MAGVCALSAIADIRVDSNILVSIFRVWAVVSPADTGGAGDFPLSGSRRSRFADVKVAPHRAVEPQPSYMFCGCSRGVPGYGELVARAEEGSEFE